MELSQVLASVKAAAALNSSIAGIGDVKDDTKLETLGISSAQLKDFKKDLHRLLTTGLEQPVGFKTFASKLSIDGKSTVSQIAHMAAGLITPLPQCSSLQPVPDGPTCQIWMVRSYFCRVRRAVRKWADPDAVPPDGISPELTLGGLIANFDAGERLRLVQFTNNEDVFQPFDVKAADPGSAVDGSTTVQGFAKALWDANPTGCSIFTAFPAEG